MSNTQTHEQAAPTSMDERIAALMARQDALEAENAKLQAEAQILRNAVPEVTAPFEPTCTLTMRPAGWDMYADDPKRAGSFLLTRPKLEIAVQLTRNGKPRIFREDAAAYRVLLANADAITAALDA